MTRTILHLLFGSAFYIIFLKFFKVSKYSFALLVLLPFAAIMELYEHKIHVADNPNNFVLVRDTVAVLLIVVAIFVLAVSKKFFNIDKEIIFFSLSIVLMIALCGLEHVKPVGAHWEWKHFVDIIAWTAGPLLVYPIIHKLLI